MSKLNFGTYKNSKRDVGSLVDKIKNMSDGGSKSYEKDERLWSYTRDKSGNAYAVLRFLPTAFEEQTTPYVFRYRHFFDVNGRYLVENCPTSPVFGNKQCPICADNKKYFVEPSEEITKYGIEGAKAIGRPRSRQSEWYANIYIIKDSQNPENEGKTMIWRFNKTIEKMIDRALKPTDSDLKAGKKPIDIFDLYNGANFELNIYSEEVNEGGKKKLYPRYDNCRWQEQSPLFDNDNDMETVYNSIHNLYEFIDPKTCKSYEELDSRLAEVLGNKSQQNKPKTEESKEGPFTAQEKEPEPVKQEVSKDNSSNDDLDDLFDDFD